MLEVPIARRRCERKSVTIGSERFLELAHKFSIACLVSGYAPSVLSSGILPVDILSGEERVSNKSVFSSCRSSINIPNPSNAYVSMTESALFMNVLILVSVLTI